MSLTFAIDIIRTFFAILDKAVYWLLETLISLFNSLASVQIFDSGVIKAFASRLYIFLAIIMIFKVSFSIIQYIINPDTFTDNEKGMGKIIQNILMSLVLLVSVQSIFSFAYDVQTKIVNENIIPNIILGVGNVDKEDQENVNKSIPFMVINAFVTPNVQVPGIEYNRQKGVYVADGIDMYTMTPEGKIKNFDGSTTESYSKGDYDEIFGDRLGTLAEDSFEEIKYNNAMKNNGYWDLLDMVNYKMKGNSDIYILDYKILITTVVGVFMLIIYLNFCMDLAIRAAKLGFLSLIAPIPIISMIDPKSSKNGLMSKWVKQCLTTYLGLFIRIAAVNFVIYIIYIIMNPKYFVNVPTGGNNVFVQLVIIFGALMFARELPKLVSDLTGINLSGDFNINPLKRFEEKTLGGKRITSTAAGLVTGSVGGLVSGAMNGRGLGRLSGAVGGLIGGTLRGGATGLVGGQGVRQTRDAIVRNRHALQTARDNGSTFGRRTAQRVEHAFGVDTAIDRANIEDDRIAREMAEIDERQANGRMEMSNNQKIIDADKAMRDRAQKRIVDGDARELSQEYTARNERVSQMEATRDALVTAAQNRAAEYRSRIAEATARANDTSLSIAERNEARNIVHSTQGLLDHVNDEADELTNQIAQAKDENHDWLTNTAVEQLINTAGHYGDGAMEGMISNYNAIARSLHIEIDAADDNAAGRHRIANNLAGRNTDIQNGFYNDDVAKQRLEDDKRRNAEQRRVAQANADAVNHTGGNGH